MLKAGVDMPLGSGMTVLLTDRSTILVSLFESIKLKPVILMGGGGGGHPTIEKVTATVGPDSPWAPSLDHGLAETVYVPHEDNKAHLKKSFRLLLQKAKGAKFSERVVVLLTAALMLKDGLDNPKLVTLTTVPLTRSTTFASLSAL
jgi:hypothetical protein